MLSEESKKALMAGVDSNPSTVGMGILVIDDERTYWLRRIHDIYTRTVLFRIIYEQKSTLPAELLSFGLNAVGTGCAWVGACAFSAAAPISGGASTPLAYVSAAAAGAGTAQTIASGVRVYNELSGNHAANAAQDNDPYYQWTMRSCDVLQLVSAAGGLKVASTAAGNLGKAQVPISTALSGMNRAQAKNLARVVGVSRVDVAGTKTALAVKQQILGGFSSVLSAISSVSGGIIKEVAIGICGNVNAGPPAMTQQFVGPVRAR